MSRFPTRRLAVLALAAGSLVLSSCSGIILPSLTPAPAPAVPTCPTGNWTVTSVVLSGPAATFAGDLTVKFDGSGISASINDDGTWSLTADQNVTLSGTTVFGAVNATGHVVGSSSGTWTRSGRGAVFTVGALSGTVAYNATVGTRTMAGTLDLTTAGLAGYYGLSGAAKYSCGTAGTLTLTLGKETLKFQQ
jgi:hypothetical protein